MHVLNPISGSAPASSPVKWKNPQKLYVTFHWSTGTMASTSTCLPICLAGMMEWFRVSLASVGMRAHHLTATVPRCPPVYAASNVSLTGWGFVPDGDGQRQNFSWRVTSAWGSEPDIRFKHFKDDLAGALLDTGHWFHARIYLSKARTVLVRGEWKHI